MYSVQLTKLIHKLWYTLNMPQQVKGNIVEVYYDLNSKRSLHCFYVHPAYKCYTLKPMCFFHCICQYLLWDYWCYQVPSRSPQIRARLSVVCSFSLTLTGFSMCSVYVNNVMAQTILSRLLSCKPTWKLTLPRFVDCSSHYNFSGVLNVPLD